MYSGNSVPSRIKTNVILNQKKQLTYKIHMTLIY